MADATQAGHDLNLVAGADGAGVGDIVFKTLGGVERGRISASGAGSGVVGGGPDPLAVALGYVNWNFNSSIGGALNALTSQRADACGIYLPPGKPISNIVLDVGVAGSGAVPAHFFVGLCTASKMIAQSANLNASAALTTLGSQLFPLAAQYVPSPADSPLGLYYVVLLEDGAFGTTPVTFLRGNASTVGYALGGTLFGNIGSGLTALPANGAAVAVSPAAGLGWHVGAS